MNTDYTQEQMDHAIEQLFFWEQTAPELPRNFFGAFYDLMEKADPPNRKRLSLSFPAEVAAFIEWEVSEDKEQFFARYYRGKLARC